MAGTKSADELLGMNLNIPDYQRPYKWGIRNIDELFLDITKAISDADRYKADGIEFKYRIGTIILHKEGSRYNIVDGQQRIISLVLLKKCIDPEFECSVTEKVFTNKTTQYNIHRNYTFIREWFSLKSDDVKKEFIRAFEKILEVVVFCVDKETEAFQLFDSQNTRGKALDPHDLLKAYHLREMKKYPYEMERAVTKWEAKDPVKIKELFDLYLFPIRNWSRGNKSKPFTAKEIDAYKGITEGSAYSYARRTSKAMPCFQITEPFIAGNDFFEMVEHYMYLLRDIKSEICSNPRFREIKRVLCGGGEVDSPEDMDKARLGSAGFGYTKNLFYCALLCYYDKFHNFDEMAVKKLFTWAFMLRVDMKNLGFDSVNKYAVGDKNSRYTNKIGIFSEISFARMHHEISGLQIQVRRNPDNGKWEELYNTIKEINGYGGAQ
ncbi:MAG TPA: DUF262 domain-containing protein [Candidatus Ornithomonoglobus intestinigallinarum]|uniref:DUF262 domain-containing protein n=1 Tax=Candidatus Ornithomonoglobus intestinigallinarum TaxID=2840894 RepID=A0A9D1H1P5_9FIRM|nr:DUF262 domain-containing protein [Candidatus Ornithomonoglobus intestinigallinarum]